MVFKKINTLVCWSVVAGVLRLTGNVTCKAIVII